MLEGLRDYTRYLGDIARRYDQDSPSDADRERGASLSEEMLCEALRYMALTPETRAEVERLVAAYLAPSWSRTSTLDSRPSPGSGRTSPTSTDSIGSSAT